MERLGAALQPIVQAYQGAMEARRLREGAFQALAASREGNAFFQVPDLALQPPDEQHAAIVDAHVEAACYSVKTDSGSK